MPYTYELNPDRKFSSAATYTLEELRQLTTVRLREICQTEKLAIGAAYRLDREYLISMILKYRGANLNIIINSYSELRYEAVKARFKQNLNFENSDIQLPTRITFYKNADTLITDNYLIDGNGIFEGNALLFDDKRRVCGILNVAESNGKHYLTRASGLLDDLPEAEYKNYSIGFLDPAGSKYLYNYYYETQRLRPTSLHCRLKTVSELIITTIGTADTPLVIDFGSSNSAAGAYMDTHGLHDYNSLKSGVEINEISYVTFPDYKSIEGCETVPTVISVADCGDPNNIVYRFGYDALRDARKNSYANSISVFSGLKKWINNYKKVEEVSDEIGKTAFVSRKDILRAYFKFIINAARQQHKRDYVKLHITSPVKQKQQYIEMYKDLLPEYEIADSTALDEGVAVLYSSISNQIERKRFDDGEEYRALIIDCGGGTTDLTSCDYYIEDNNITYKLRLTTTYANGEQNFGGNNITYRIFQYIKILFADFYAKNELKRVNDIFGAGLSDVYRRVDAEDGHAKLYAPLEEMYAQRESLIPTRYYDFRNSPAEEYMKVKSNFYFLWNLAEKIKIDFFQTISVNQTSFHERGLKHDVNDSKIIAEESWTLHVYKKARAHEIARNIVSEWMDLTPVFDPPGVVITKEEITALIKADIYHIIKKFIEPMYFDGQLSGFNFIKLTGQTCKIDIFRDALKEFIPGRVIESSKKEKTVRDYKLICLDGALKYQNAQKIGLIAPEIKNAAPITPYKLIAFTHSGTETTLIERSERLTKTYGYASRNIDTESVKMTLLDADGKRVHEYILRTNARDFTPTTYEELTREYSEKIYQDDIDNIIDNEIKIFTFAFEDKWGFYALPIARRDGTLYVGQRQYLPFENDEWEINFFDGRK
ncbi:MAG: hypothetical protein LBL35_08525 [Clostridiales bacterium]|jgi:hypothetical protein|nr:hypothetical protein [Clostridiales bacterium]